MSRHSSNFQTTCWEHFQSINSGNPRLVKRALNEICKTYWTPLYHFAVSMGCSHQEAEDCVQGFLATASTSDFFNQADQSKGRMRSFLLISFKRYVYDEWKKNRAKKRGGDTLTCSYHEVDSSSNEPDPAIAFDQHWAITVIETAKSNLKKRYTLQNKKQLYAQLEACIDGTPLPHAQKVSEALEMSPSALKAAIFRIRQRFGQEVRNAVAETVTSEHEIDDELSWLIEVLNK